MFIAVSILRKGFDEEDPVLEELFFEGLLFYQLMFLKTPKMLFVRQQNHTWWSPFKSVIENIVPALMSVISRIMFYIY